MKFSCKIRKEAISLREQSEVNLALRRLRRDGKEIPCVWFPPSINILFWNVFSSLRLFLLTNYFF